LALESVLERGEFFFENEQKMREGKKRVKTERECAGAPLSPLVIKKYESFPPPYSHKRAIEKKQRERREMGRDGERDGR
jgi:hypothetical protein